jgi:selenocysteine-specific elongation factor
MKLVSEGKAVSLSEDTYVHVEYTEKVRKATEDILAEYYGKNPISPGMQKGEFRKKLADKLHIADIKNIDLLLSHLVKKEQLRDLGNSVALPGHRVEYTPELLALISRLEKRYLDAGFEIPELEDCIQDEKDKELAKQMVEAMSESGTLKKLTYQYYMHSSHWEEAMKRFRNHMEQHGKITLAEYRDLLNTSRKYAVLILEYLDQQKITKMVDDARILL